MFIRKGCFSMVKNKLLALLNIFAQYTDDDNKLTTNQLIDKLSEEGISAHRNTIPKDIETLQSAGYDIICEKSKQNLYYMGSRTFDNAEIKLLCDAVRAAQFISEKQTEHLIDKILQNVSFHTAEKIRRIIQAPDTSKITDTSIYCADIINTAIEKKKKVSFQYYEYDENKTKVLKHNGYVYVVSPYAAVWHEDRYYMIGYSEKHKEVSSFRIDRMANTQINDTVAVQAPSDFDVQDYLTSKVKLYKGIRTEVSLRCKNKHMKSVIDHFGNDIRTVPDKRGYFIANISVELSPTFYAWLFQYGGEITIESPQNAVTGFVKMAETVLKVHK